MKKQKIIIILLLLIYSFGFSQDCKPTTKSEDGSIEFFGGPIKDGLGIMTDDKSNYTFYVAQVEKGNGGTLAYVSFYESVASKSEYNNNITNYLNTESLKNSFLEITLTNEVLNITSSNCLLTPNKTMGDISGYSVSFEGDINKDQIIALQNSEILKFKIVLGGKPYEKNFNKSTKKTRAIKKAIQCVNLENMLSTETTAANMNLDEVSVNDYLKEIKGIWLLKAGKGLALEFIENKIIVKKSNRIISEGAYRIIGNRLVFTGKNSGTSTFELFLKDMIILKEDGKEYTYTRVK